MRIKALLSLAALAVGLSTSMAQNVYSLNVVGYINITVGAGYTLCANQLNNGTNGINQVLANPPSGALVLTFVNNDYKTDVADAGAWLDNTTGDPSTTTLGPGKGFFYNAPAAATLTLVGEVPQGQTSIPLPAGYAMIGTYTPQALALSTANGFPMTDGTLYLKFANNNYVTDVIDAGAWIDNTTGDPATVVPAIGEGYFINAPTATAWNYSFTVQ